MAMMHHVMIGRPLPSAAPKSNPRINEATTANFDLVLMIRRLILIGSVYWKIGVERTIGIHDE
jgi:hypothetical protein